jgi:hypothetical protein
MYFDNAKGFKAASKEICALYCSIHWNKVKDDDIKNQQREHHNKKNCVKV